MNTKHLLTASIVGGLTSLVLANAPYISLVNLLLCAGFWIGPLVAAWLYRRLEGTLTLNQALVAGLLAGIWHGLFGLLLSPLGLAGAGSLLKELPDLGTAVTGTSGLLFNLVGVAVDIVFGLIGGLIGGVIFGVRRVTS
jgi:hypothetical protein